MDVVVKEQVFDERINKSAIRFDKDNKDYYSLIFDGHIISYFVCLIKV
ncbi:hypothetical protein CNO14_07085 (plasmid) [Borrelia miyamotoi]|uniref:Uncharacterized protein n=2 Tax=Borrelia miyamotoi TaxID=47466 RepID=A0AAQ3CN31_9SPIR|nr:hypothetical protein [Borrelia miyamotoi]WAZ71368.1 hypothetical protein O5403_06905 [Borrelia miyamotoi]WCB91098.1 hypothetical protein CNO11_07570 [Borrelia miyamotoi]WCL22215.1 hypothetical protein CNO10_07520 [Borrelia miyamotoi]WDE70417.1 hypothetical protein CNO12_07410 [Borrelia miyamotoi]WDE73180.1 hypothetical protein CNO14_07085 [Borrelia miyamotoi]